MIQTAATLRSALSALALTIAKCGIRAYQLTLSPFVGHQCRFHPTCSNYAIAALDGHGPVKGIWLALRRLSKCHPFHPGGFDPPPVVRTAQESLRLSQFANPFISNQKPDGQQTVSACREEAP